jgi:Mor family transcriptional regulator
MSYIKAADVLPKQLVQIVQNYIDGEYIYIPRKEAARKAWGEKTKSREIIAARNLEIAKKYGQGISIASLSKVYYLSPKSLQRIIAKSK